MIAFLAFLSLLFTVAGLAALVVWREFRAQYKFVGLFIISKFKYQPLTRWQNIMFDV